MHERLPRAALGLALLLCACHREPAPADSGTGAGGPLLPNYTDRGIVVVDAQPQRPNFWDFDIVTYGDRPAHVFRLKNLDPDPVTIRSAVPSCGCLQITLSSADGQQIARGGIAPDARPFVLATGSEIELRVTVDTSVVEKTNSDKLAWVRVVCDSKNTPYLAFEVHVKVLRDFLCTPRLVDLGEIPQGYDKRATGTLTPEDVHSPAALLGIERIEGPYTATLDETRIGEVRSWMLAVDAKVDAPQGLALGKVVIRTTGSDGTGSGRPFEVPLSGRVVPRIVARPAAVRMSLVKDSATIELECLVPGQKVELKNVRFEGPGPDFVGTFAAEHLDGKQAAKWKIDLRLSGAGAQGGFTRTAVLELDDPQIPELRVPVTVDAL